MKYVRNVFALPRRMLPSFESQKTVTEKTTKGETQAYSPLETPLFLRRAHNAHSGAGMFLLTVGAIINRPQFIC